MIKFTRTFKFYMKNSLNLLRIYNNSKVIVIGGGPAGAFFSYYILKLAK